jgi:hypothetical protein
MEKLSNLHRIGKLYGLPDFVKEAEFDDNFEILPSSAFAALGHVVILVTPRLLLM